jgi:hypothetical protein
MNNLKRFYEKVRRGLSRPRTLWILALVVVVAVGVGCNIRDSHQREAKQQSQLAQLAKQQKQKAEQQEKLNQTVKQHEDDLFTDATVDSKYASACARLQNRPGIVLTSGCNYNIRAHGKIDMAVVFIYDNDYYKDDLNILKGASNNPDSLQYINTYLKNQAARYKVSDPAQINMTFYGAYKSTEPAANLYYMDNRSKLLDIFQATSAANNVPEQNYDMVQYVLLNRVYGGVAFPGAHRAFTENSYTVPTFIHETLHLFGASDKYNNNDCNTVGTSDPFGRYNGSLPGVDIMCSNFSLGSSIINDITAREIGWQN